MTSYVKKTSQAMHLGTLFHRYFAFWSMVPFVRKYTSP